MDEQPTVEQSLHSIALSLIGIHEELKETRRIHKNALRHSKHGVTFIQRITTANARSFKKRTVWDWLRDQLTGGTSPVLSRTTNV